MESEERDGRKGECHGGERGYKVSLGGEESQERNKRRDKFELLLGLLSATASDNNTGQR